MSRLRGTELQVELAGWTDVPEKRVGEALLSLLDKGKVTRSGRGVKGDPYRYLRADSILPGSPLDTNPGRNASQRGDGSWGLATVSEGDSILPGPVSRGKAGGIESEHRDAPQEQATESGGDSILPGPSSRRKAGGIESEHRDVPQEQATASDGDSILPGPASRGKAGGIDSERAWEERREAMARGQAEPPEEPPLTAEPKDGFAEAVAWSEAHPAPYPPKYAADGQRLLELEAEMQSTEDLLASYPRLKTLQSFLYVRWDSKEGQLRIDERAIAARFGRPNAFDKVAEDFGYTTESRPRLARDPGYQMSPEDQFRADILAYHEKARGLRDLRAEAERLAADVAAAEAGDFSVYEPSFDAPGCWV